uniref:Uncharacterized protein n=1 Tax=Arundo donax TaxID=35708 RepID=A0A0A9GV75_ARUDO
MTILYVQMSGWQPSSAILFMTCKACKISP